MGRIEEVLRWAQCSSGAHAWKKAAGAGRDIGEEVRGGMHRGLALTASGPGLDSTGAWP